jgi:hypothetical protein
MQGIFHEVLRLYDIWQQGNPALAEQCRDAAHRCVALMRFLYTLLGEEFYTAKAHDLYHISYDLSKFGALANCDTGTVS